MEMRTGQCACIFTELNGEKKYSIKAIKGRVFARAEPVLMVENEKRE